MGPRTLAAAGLLIPIVRLRAAELHSTGAISALLYPFAARPTRLACQKGPFGQGGNSFEARCQRWPVRGSGRPQAWQAKCSLEPAQTLDGFDKVWRAGPRMCSFVRCVHW